MLDCTSDSSRAVLYILAWVERQVSEHMQVSTYLYSNPGVSFTKVLAYDMSTH